MEQFDADTWDEVTEKFNTIAEKYGEHAVGDYRIKIPILYRGQARACWRLETTLERYHKKKYSADLYSRLTMGCAPEIESYSGQRWDLPKDHGIDKDPTWFQLDPKYYEYWIFLRHHGFPSPLLDWTASPYIAAFFALEDMNDAKTASIFAYIEMPKARKSVWGGETKITLLGSKVRTHKRHFLQQSRYTVCTKTEDEAHVFTCHEDVFEKERDRQDMLVKITIPRKERLRILKYLNEVNINQFSLFQTEDALMNTMAFKEIELRYDD